MGQYPAGLHDHAPVQLGFAVAPVPKHDGHFANPASVAGTQQGGHRCRVAAVYHTKTGHRSVQTVRRGSKPGGT
jgi:hypothetical protein